MREVSYLVRMDPGVQTPEETLTLASGSCRDSAWLQVQVLRKLGLAARFVSGYLIQLKADVAALDGPSGTTQDFCDLHAWAEVFLPGAGWIGLDATSGLLCGEGHLPLAATPHYRSAAPISGLVEPANVEFEFEMSVVRLLDPVRITKPFEDDRWLALNALGTRVDKHLAEGDVRLTMGGEPTFCSIDDFESAEWNTDAVGPDQARPGRPDDPAPARPLRPRRPAASRPGQVVSGRAAAPLGFRPLLARSTASRSGANADTITGEPEPDETRRMRKSPRRRPSTSPPSPRRFAATAGPRPRLHPAGLRRPAPLDRDGGQASRHLRRPPSWKIDAAPERRRLLQVFDRGLSEPRAYVLPHPPLADGQERRGWLTEAWTLRRGRMFLVPGDSPAGFRLPLGSLPELDPDDYPHIRVRDPFEPRGRARAPTRS